MPVMSAHFDHILLIGMPGSGKTKLGGKLAQLQRLAFRDLDEELVQHTGMSVRSFFTRRGEEAFRVLESRILADALKGESTVIATGGGVILKEENRLMMKEHNLVIYIDIKADILFRRLKDQTDRPLLMGGNRRERLGRLLSERESLYRHTAHLVFRGGDMPPDEAAARLHNMMEDWKKT